MLKSLFGDLGPLRSAVDKPAAPDRGNGGFADTTILERADLDRDASKGLADRPSGDLIMSGSPAQAIRDHFSTSRADLDTASRQITMYDPAGAWAGAVIKALSDSAGGPIERMHLREENSLRLLATIERTTLVRRNEDTLKIYNADVRAGGPGNAEIPVTLMESSHLAVVIVGPMEPPAIEAMLAMLAAASRRPAWRCPNMLFLLPPGAVEIAARIAAQPWPEALRLQVLDESLTSASAVWNAMLLAWNHIKALPGWDAAGGNEPSARIPAFSIGTPTLDEPAAPAMVLPTPVPVGAASSFASTGPGELRGLDPISEPRPRRSFDPARAAHSLDGMAGIDGLFGCALVHVTSGLVVAHAVGIDRSAFDVELAAAAATQVLRSHRLAAANLGLAAPLDEIMVSAGTRLLVLRTLERHADLFLCALLDKQRTNLALARHALAEVEKGLA